MLQKFDRSKFDPAKTAAVFGCTVQQLGKQYRENAARLREMKKVAESGGYCNGLGLQQINVALEDAEWRSDACLVHDFDAVN